MARRPGGGEAPCAADDPELFATYFSLATQARDVVRAHVDALVEQAARIIADGVARGEFTAVDPAAAGRAVLHATTRFHSPAHASEWSDPSIDEALDQVWRLLASGLEARAVEGRQGPQRRRAGSNQAEVARGGYDFRRGCAAGLLRAAPVS